MQFWKKIFNLYKWIYQTYIGTAEKGMNTWLVINLLLYTQYKHLWNQSLKNISGLFGIQTHSLCNTDAVPYQQSYQAIWERSCVQVPLRLEIFSGFNFATAHKLCDCIMRCCINSCPVWHITYLHLFLAQQCRKHYYWMGFLWYNPDWSR